MISRSNKTQVAPHGVETYNESLTRLMAARSRALHKAGSVRRTLEPEQRTKLQEQHEDEAEAIKDQIVALIAATFPDERPLPPYRMDYEGVEYVLGAWDGVTARYSPAETAKVFTVVVYPSNWAAHIRHELDRIGC